jgi:hypothetical protein
MPKKAKSPTPPIRWEFPQHVPSLDFFEGMDLDDDGNLAEAIENFIFSSDP